MLFQQFYLRSLGHASYLVGDEKTGRALVFDPRRDVEIYTRAAREQGCASPTSPTRTVTTTTCPG